MRAAPLVLLALATAEPGPSEPGPSEPGPAAAGLTEPAPSALRPAALVLLPAVCADPTAFERDRLLQHAPSLTHYDVTVLPHKETCGAQWQRALVAAVRGAGGVAGGAGGVAGVAGAGVVLAAGWPGRRACALLWGAEGGAGGAGGASCGRGAGRAAAVSQLSAALRWRRVLLPAPPSPPSPTPPAPAPLSPTDDHCEAALTAITDQLLFDGLTVRRATITQEELTHQPNVVILCASSRPELALRDAPAVLLLRFEDAYSTSNITLDVGSSPYVPVTSDTATVTNENFNFSRNYLTLFKKRSVPENNRYPEKSYTHLSSSSSLNLLLTNKNEANIRKQIEESKTETSIKTRKKREIDDGRLLLLLSDIPLSEIRLSSRLVTERAYRRIEEQARGQRRAEDKYLVYEAEAGAGQRAGAVWRPVLALQAAAPPPAGLQAWAAARAASPARPAAAPAALWGGLGAAAALAVLALASSWALCRAARRRARRRADVVLDPRDLVLPEGECRRVDAGMETMLSCWLQQLHEFGGPELERPDLLKQPAPVPGLPRTPTDARAHYKGDAVHLKPLPVPVLELRRKAIDVLLVMQSLRNENLNPFVGAIAGVGPGPRAALVWEWMARGSLEAVLRADQVRLDWPFRLSLLTDAARGLRYLHASPLRLHGRLSSRNCLVDSRWVLRLTDHGEHAFRTAQGMPHRLLTAKDMLWTAPELLREWRDSGVVRGTQAGDVFSLGIIMQEVIVRGEPYCMLPLSADEIVDKLCRPPPLIRPSVSLGAAPPDAVSVMRQCWAEAPDLRPDTPALADQFRLMHQDRKINIVDSMFEMLEKYSNNLEELIKERTEQLDMEKKKTEQLLNRMLPRSVAERLLLGQRVQPEEFSDVTVYFSDIVGFTELAAQSSPVQVVDLLNDLYSCFDAAIQQHHVYKVETIGDAYMVVGGLPARCPDHAERVATMALHLLSLAGTFRVRHRPGRPLLLRCGMHSGPCCAGVVGLTMPRYCLFGDTVNTAARMESTGAAWRVQLSAATAARLRPARLYRLRSRGLTMVKGKGAMHTYWLLGKDGFDMPLPTPPPLQTEEQEDLAVDETAKEEEIPEADADDDTQPSDSGPTPNIPEAEQQLTNSCENWYSAGAGTSSADRSPPAAARPPHPLPRQWSAELPPAPRPPPYRTRAALTSQDPR